MNIDHTASDREPDEALSPRAALRRNKTRFRFRRVLEQKLSDKLLTTLTILLSVLVFVIAPLQANGVIAGRYFGLIFGAVLIPAAFMLAANWLAAGSIVAAIALVVVASEVESSIVDAYLDAAAWLIAGMTLSAVVARAVFGPGKVTFHRIVGGILLYLTIGLTFVALFGLVAIVIPDAFKGLEPLKGNFAIAGNLIYFSFVTLTTIGYGDIVPVHPYARGLANLEAVIGQLYPATLLARLVSLEIVGDKRT
jgi:Ion channel